VTFFSCGSSYQNQQNTQIPPGNTPLLKQFDLSADGVRDYTFGDAGHLEQVKAGANEINFTSDEAGRLDEITRAGESATFAYDDRSFIERVEKPLGSDQVPGESWGGRWVAFSVLAVCRSGAR
jgi:hypothetical protein